MATMRFFRTRDGLLQAKKRAFSVQEFREAVKEMERLVGNDPELRKAIGIDAALDYSKRLKETPAKPAKSTRSKDEAFQAVRWSLEAKL